MTDDLQKKRQFLFGVLAVILVIGVGGVVAAMLSSSSSSDSPSGATTPGASVDPLSPQGVCRADRIVAYAVSNGPDDKVAFTATSAAAPWLREGEASQTTSVDDTTKLVSLAPPGKEPREVLTVRQVKAGWQVALTTACLDASKNAETCAATKFHVLTVAGKSYKSQETTSEPGAYVGQGELTPCFSDTTAFVARGPVAPVTAYRSGKNSLVVTEGSTNRLYSAG